MLFFPLKVNVDAQGGFTELLKTAGSSQFNVAWHYQWPALAQYQMRILYCGGGSGSNSAAENHFEGSAGFLDQRREKRSCPHTAGICPQYYQFE